MRSFTLQKYIGFLTLLLVVFSTNAKAQRRIYSIQGTVTNAFNGKPLPGASVFIQDARLGVAADTAGRFRFSKIPQGHHLVEVSHAGFANAILHLDVARDTALGFVLQPSVTENAGVTVTGVSNATSIRQSPIPVTVVGRTALLHTPATNIVDALARQPGVSQVATGPAISKPVIRGLGYNRVVVINDGVRQEGQQWGDEHGLEMDDASIQKAEILKGPASLMYGSDALAGVINLITNNPVAEGTFKGSLLTNYQTNNRLQSYHANIAGNKEGFSWNAYGTRKSAGDYRNDYDGRVLNSRFGEYNVGGYIGLNRSWGYSHLIVSSFNQKAGIVEGDRDAATGAFLLFGGSPLERIAMASDLKGRKPLVPYQHIRHKKIALDNSVTVGRSRIKANIGLQQNNRTELGNPEEPQEQELHFDLRTATYNLQWQLPEMRQWRTTIGLSGMNQQNRNKGEERIIPDYRFNDAGAFFFVQGMFEKHTISGGLRFDNRHIRSDAYTIDSEEKFGAFTRNYSNFSGSAGIAYTPAANLTLKTNFASGFRAPNMAELASNGAHEGTNRFEYGSQDLKSERSFQWDASVDVNEEHVSLTADVFMNVMDNYIYYRRLAALSGGDSLIYENGEELQAFRFSQNNARLHGFEVSVDLHPHPLDWLHFENSLAYVRGKFNQPVDGSLNLPLIPATRWNSELRANVRTLGSWLRNGYANLEMNHFFKQHNPFTGYNTETPTAAYTLLNASAGTDIVAKGKTIFSVYLAVQNLTDKAYQNHLSRLKYTDANEATGRAGIFGMGRNFSVKLLLPLSGKL
jgi:iron complex outermembrane recepter protein